MNPRQKSTLLWLCSFTYLCDPLLAQPAPPSGWKTNWIYFAATALDTNGLESEKSSEVSEPRYIRHLWRTATLSWDAVTNAAGYRIYWGPASCTYTGSSELFLGTTGTVRILPPPPSNVLIEVTTTKATNLAATDRVDGPWVMLGRTNFTATNPHAPQFYRSVGSKPGSSATIKVTKF